MKKPTKTIEIASHRRAAAFSKNGIDVKNRTVPIAFSSEAPVMQWYPDHGMIREVLSHERAAVDLSVMEAGAPFTVNHDKFVHIGVNEKPEVSSDRRGRSVVRFGRSEESQRYFNDVSDGIRTGISMRYRVRAFEVRSDDAGPFIFATNWQPFETSLESIPGDPVNTGVARSDSGDTQTCEVYTMKDDNNAATGNGGDQSGQRSKADEAFHKDELRASIELARKDEKTRIKHLIMIGEQFTVENQAKQFIDNGRSVVEFQAWINDNHGADVGGERVLSMSGANPTAAKKLDMEHKEIKRFSMLRALNAVANPNNQRAQKAAAFERECSEAARELTDHPTQGFLIPNGKGGEQYGFRTPQDVIEAPGQRALVTTSAASAGNLIETDLQSGSFIDNLRNSAAVTNLGARMLENLSGNVAIPRKTTSITAAWLATEVTSIAESNLVTELLSMSPNDVGARQHYSKRMLNQSSIGLEQLVRDDLAQSIALAWDLAALYGTGSGGQPTGVANTSGIGAPTAFAAAIPTWAETTAMIGNLALNNAFQGSPAYLLNGTMMADLMAVSKDTGSGRFVYENGRIGSIAAPFSNQVTAGDLFLGVWSDLIIGIWGGGLDLVLDPYTLADTQTVRVIGSIPVDFGVRHPESFALNNDGV